MTTYGPRHRPRRLTPRAIADAVEAAADVSEKADRLVSKKRFAELTGFDRGTLDAWVDKGCPVEKRGAEYVVDVKAVWRWREEQVRTESLRTSGMTEGGGFAGWLGIDDPGKAFAAQERLIKVNLLRGEIVHRAPMEAAVERAMGLIRQAVMAVPDRLAREMAGFPKDRVEDWRRKGLDHCRVALGEGAKAIQRAMDGPSA